MSYEVYFEAQDQGSALCGQHAINNLLQGAYFTAIDLGHIGSRLDEQEQNLLFSIDEDEKLTEEPQNGYNNTLSSKNTKQRKYSNVSMEGLFSVDVLITALKQLDIDALPLNHPSCSHANEHPDKEQGFIFYQMSHWIAYCKVNNIWYDLNSQSNYLLIDPQPVRITEFYLSAQISKLQDEGFQVYVIRGSLPTLGRYAPKSDDLKGEYQWYQSADIEPHVDLVKKSQKKQEEEQRIKTRQLMLHDPQQYNALMGNNTYNNFSVQDPYGMNIQPKYQMYHKQQQWLAMEQFKNKNNNNSHNNNNNNNNNTANNNQNGIIAKISNPFSKLKKIYQEKTKDIKTKINGNGDNNVYVNNGNNNAEQYLNDLERATQESLKTATTQNNNNTIIVNNNKDFSDLNTPNIATYGQTQHHATYDTNNINSNPYGQNIIVVSEPNTNQTQINTKTNTNTGDDDIQLAMALSASIVENKQNNNNILSKPKKENIELEFEMTDHKPKIIQKQQIHHQQEDFLDIMSMSNNNKKDDEKNIVLDDNDPFSSLIKQYSDEKKQNINTTNGNDQFDMLDFGNNNNNNNNNMEKVQFENNLFGDNTTNDMMTLIDDINKNNENNNKSNTNPLISPNNNGSGDSMGFNYNDPAKQMEDDLWRILEQQLTDQQ